jgi:hypothetical protein
MSLLLSHILTETKKTTDKKQEDRDLFQKRWRRKSTLGSAVIVLVLSYCTYLLASSPESALGMYTRQSSRRQ